MLYLALFFYQDNFLIPIIGQPMDYFPLYYNLNFNKAIKTIAYSWFLSELSKRTQNTLLIQIII